MNVALRSGAEGRWTNAPRRHAVVLVNGGQARDVPGTWSATLEWLVQKLAPAFPELGFLEVKYRSKSWKRLGMCVEDGASAIAHARESGAESCALVAFSMGGAVAIRLADEPSVRAVIALAPWIPDRLDLSPLADRRFAVIHGAFDRGLPGIPGVRAASSRRGFDRARADGVDDAAYTLIPAAFHGVALRGRSRLIALPRAHRWVELVGDELRRFERS